MILKVLGPEISITSANTVGDSKLVRVINTGAPAVLNIGSTANVTVLNTEPVFIVKEPTDTLTGSGMVAAPIAYRY